MPRKDRTRQNEELRSEEFVDLLREVLGLCPLPEEKSRKRCPCGKKPRSKGEFCARCSGSASNRWRYAGVGRVKLQTEEGTNACQPGR